MGWHQSPWHEFVGSEAKDNKDKKGSYMITDVLAFIWEGETIHDLVS